MLRLIACCLTLHLAACVAPEPPPTPRRAAAPQEPRRADLEPAPLANRKMKPPPGNSVINTDLGPLGATKPATPAR